ncbi:hypothetical protein ACH5RR_010642 [Cinchona calisaya]|uniref:Major pollen allergen Ole e 6-like n=1 Tax=Cinchona calisaya TaxID=153742 RepID=A0ABD3AJI7_9GENT
MEKKFEAVLLLCLVGIAAMHTEKADATSDDQKFKECYDTCHKECFKDGKGNGYTFCEMKCDADCATKEIKAKLMG